jgi:hypothetical protein
MSKKAFCFILAVATTACDGPRVRWEQPQAAPADTVGAIALAAGNTLRYWRDSATHRPSDPAMCPASLTSATQNGVEFHSWLRLRPDSTVVVMASRWDGTTGTTPAIVDSLDVGQFGCNRPAPSIAISDDGSVHVAYSLKAPEGYGVFFGHSMNRAINFHEPMIVVYGDRLSATAIASHGPRVAIAYEDPSGKVRRIDVALSNTQGHTFEPREHASPDEMTATHPRIAIRDTVVALSFAGADTTQRAVRFGYLRK